MPDFSTPVETPPMPTPVYIPEEPDPVYTDLGAPYVIEYGKPFSIIGNNDPFHAYIRFPQAGNPTDAEIYIWALEQYNDMAVSFNTGIDFSPADFGEINIQFHSYLIDNRYAGIHQFGEYSYNTTDIPGEINKTFNIDLLNFKILETEDIFDLDDPEGLLQLLSLRLLVEHPNTDGYHNYIDETWLKYLLITHEGIKVFLPHSEFLPDSFESLTVMLPYEDLGSALMVRQDAPLPAMPVPTPEPAPAPDPDSDPDEDAESNPDDNPEGNPDSGIEDDSESSPDSGIESGSESDPDSGTDNDPEGNIEENLDDVSADEPDDPYANLEKQGGSVDPGRPTIALTFDDGPGIYTGDLLDLLEQYGVRATFFTVGNIIHTEESTVIRAVDLGCEIAGHSWNHKNMAKMNADDVRLQLETTQAAIEAITGVFAPIFRPPYGAVSDTMKDVAEQLGMSIVKWSTDPEDWKYQDADYIYDRIIEQVYDRAIIISHEISARTVEAYKKAIPELMLQGYQIVTVSELLNLTYDELTPGYVYYSGVYTEVLT